MKCLDPGGPIPYKSLLDVSPRAAYLWVVVRDHHALDGWCRVPMATLATLIPGSVQTVYTARDQLIEYGLLKYEDKISKAILDGERIAPKKEDEEKDVSFAVGTRQYEGGRYIIERLRLADSLDSDIAKKYEDDPEAVIQDAAGEIDKLQRLDGHSFETIAKVLRFATDPGSFWMEKKALRTYRKLRSKKKDTKERYFSIMLKQCEASAGGRPINAEKYADVYDE